MTAQRRTLWLGKLDALALWFVRWQGWVWPFAYGLLLGTAGFWLSHPEASSALLDNRLSVELRRSALFWGAGGLIACALLWAVLLLLLRQLRGAWPEPGALTRLNLIGAPCLGVPLWVMTLSPGFETHRPHLAVLFPLLIGLSIGVSAYALQLPERLLAWSSALAARASRRWPSFAPRPAALAMAALLLTGFGLYGAWFSHLSITNHRALRTATFDLGLYDNIFYQTSQGTLLGCSFLAGNSHGAAHFDPLLILLSPLYFIYPRAELLLVLQSFWLAAGVFPIYWLARHVMGSRPLALLVATTWLFYPALHGVNMYEFHSLALIAPLIPLLVYALVTERTVLYWLSLGLALLAREDVPLLTCFIAAGGLLTKRPFAVRQGWLTLLVSIAYFVIAKAYFMSAPDRALLGTTTYSFAYYYQELIPNGAGIGELVSSLLTNPSFALRLVLTPDKVLFALLLLVPLGFLPFWAPRFRIALGYGFPFCLLATREPVYSIYFQYATVIFAAAFPLVPVGLVELRSQLVARYGLEPRALERALVITLCVTTLLVSRAFGGIWENGAFRAGFSAPDRHLDEGERRRYAWVEQSAQLIPKEASVGTTRRLGPHVSNRRHVYGYPSATLYDYLFLDESQLDPKHKATHEATLQRGEYQVLSRFQQLVLYKRSSP